MAESPAARGVKPREAQAPHSPGLYRASVFSVGARLARLLPLPLLRRLAGAVGWLYGRAHPDRVAIVQRNLGLLDAGLDRPHDARRVYAEFGRTLADYFFIGSRPAADAVRIIAQIDGVEHLHAAHRQGKGALVVTAHLGLFELGGLLLSQHGLPGVVLTYPEPSRALSEWRASYRRRWKVDTLEIGTDSFSFLQIAQRLRQGCFVATLVDRPHPTDSSSVRMPNGTARFSTGILLLAAHSGVPVIPATMIRREDGSYHAQVFPPLQIEALATRGETLRFYSQKIADAFLPVLRAYPHQWYQFVPLAAPPTRIGPARAAAVLPLVS